MTSLISTLKSWSPFPKRLPDKCLFLGMDSSGKTTLLYILHLGYIVTTIPTIGFNVETIKTPSGHQVECWDIGGCDRIAPLVRHYCQLGTAMLFLHNVTERVRFDESIELLHLHCAQILDGGGRYVWIALSRQDLVDAGPERVELVRDLKERFEKEMSRWQGRIQWRIFCEDGMTVLDKRFFVPIMEEIGRTLEVNRGTYETEQDMEERVVREAEPKREDLLKRIREEGKDESGSEVFWRQFCEGELERWDHRAHLRAGYLILLRSLEKMESVTEAAETFLEHLTKLREGNPERFRNTQHRTMTMFWLFQLRHALLTYRQKNNLLTLPSPSSFHDILLTNPHLMNTGIWKKHYTKNILFSPYAKDYWRLPDLEPLPELTQTASTMTTKKIAAPTPQAQKIDDKHATRLPRFALSIVQTYLSTNERRGALIARALNSLRSTTMRQRATDSSVPPYSETQAYFWIQLFHAAAATLAAEAKLSVTKMSFESFVLVLGLDIKDGWREYYTEKLWDSAGARMSFLPPDKKALPNVLGKVKEEVVRDVVVRDAETDGAWSGRNVVPDVEELGFKAREIREELEKLGDKAESDEISSHAHLLMNLYRRLAIRQTSASKEDGEKQKQTSIGTDMTAAINELSGPLVASFTAKAFWVQLFVAAAVQQPATITGITSTPSNGIVTSPETNGASTHSAKLLDGFMNFLVANLHLAYADLPYVYYSRERWESYEASVAFVAPDLRELPRFIGLNERQEGTETQT